MPSAFRTRAHGTPSWHFLHPVTARRRTPSKSRRFAQIRATIDYLSFLSERQVFHRSQRSGSRAQSMLESNAIV
jgi:hypothetical protein